MEFNDYSIEGKNGREKLKNANHGIRKEQIDKKFHNLFDAYDVNKDGTLEQAELEQISSGLVKFAGTDKVLNSVEANSVNSLFTTHAGIQNADFMGFVKSVSDAGQDILKSTERFDDDGGKIISTKYKNGLTETLYFYPDGEFKLKTQFQDTHDKSIWYEFNGKRYTEQQRKDLIDSEYNKYKNNNSASGNKEIKGVGGLLMSKDLFTENFLKTHPQLATPHSMDNHILIDNTELSERAKKDVEIRDFVLNHFIQTHKECKEALASMGFLDKTGALINASAGEAWNWIKNKWNGTEDEYKNIYELISQFEGPYERSVQAEGRYEDLNVHPAGYFNGFDTLLGSKYTDAKGEALQQAAETFQNAQILKSRIDILNQAMLEISMYENEQNALTYAPAQSEGMNPASHILKANNLLLEYFGGDKEAVKMLMSGTIGNAQGTISTIKSLAKDTEKMYDSVLGGRSFEQVQEDYKSQYKNMYGTDFVPEELTEKVMDAKATGSFVKLAAITIVSVLITRSPIMAELTAAAGGAEVTGAAANMIKTLASRYGASAVQQGIKFAMTSGTLATDVGLTLLNQLSSERGIDGEELAQSALSSAKYIYFGSYIGAPIAQAVGNALGKAGLAKDLFKGGVVKSQNGGVLTETTVSGEQFAANLLERGKAWMPKALSKGAALTTEVGMFTALEVATEGANVAEAFKEQSTFLPKLKIMNHVLEYMLGARAHTGTKISRPKMESAIQNSGIKDWNITEHKTTKGTTYTVDVDGIPIGKFNDVNSLTAAMFERVTTAYAEPEVKVENQQQKTVSEEDIRTEAKKLIQEYSDAKDGITQDLQAAGIDKLGSFGFRIKSEQSLYDKLVNYMQDNPSTTLEKAVKSVRDAYGARTVFKTGNFANHPEVKSLLDAGKDQEAALRAAELQSQPALEQLKTAIEKQAIGKDGLKLARISNYVANDGIPIFSEAQLAELKQFGAQHGVDIDYVVKIDKSDPNYAQMKEAGLKPTTKSQPSGYTALQVNFKTNSGKTLEWQFRGELVDRFAEGEHIPYDLRTNKDIVGAHTELEAIYAPIKNILAKENMPEEAYKEYNRYLGDYYTHLRKLELGFESAEPKLEDYGKDFKFDNRLSAENLIKLHYIADKLKHGEISQEQALKEYTDAINKPKTRPIKEEAPVKVKTPVESKESFSFLNLSENPSAEEINTVKENIIKLLNFHAEKYRFKSAVEDVIKNIQGITDVNALKNITEIYKFMQEQGIEIKLDGFTGQIFEPQNVHNNLEGFKEVFNYLKENSQYETDNIVGIALQTQPESVQCVKELYDFLSLKKTGFEKDFMSECQFEDLTPEVVKVKQDIFNLSEKNKNITIEDTMTSLLAIKQESLDIVNKILTEYKNGNIKNVKLTSLIGHLSNLTPKRTKEFVLENFDLLMKYQNEAWRILPVNIDLVKAAAERNLPVEDVTRLINLTREYGYRDFVAEQVRKGGSCDEITKLVFNKTISEKISQPLPYEPSLAYELDPFNTGAPVKSMKPVYPFEGLPTKAQTPEKTIAIPDVEDLFLMLEKGQTVKVAIPDEGGAKPVEGYNKIHPEDRAKLGVPEEACYEIRYGEKRNWSDSKIARDVMQNFYDGHTYTMEGVSVEVVKVGDKYKVKVTGDGTYDYRLLEETGASAKPDYSESGGHYGEGAKVAAVSLLNKPGVDYVQYGCGEWVKTFNSAYDEILNTDYMTETLTENKTPVKGNFFEFTTDDINLVHQMLEAKDYFKHPFNTDFQNMDFENEFFAIKKLPEGQKGNLYIVQRYETGSGIENSVDGFNIVFKTKPENPNLMQNSSIHHTLGSDRDRSAISNTQLSNLLTMYGTTMSREDLAKLIVSMEPVWNKSERTPQENAILKGILAAAEEKILDIDFGSKKYVYIDKRASVEDIEMARTMGYKPISVEALKKVGLKSVSEVTAGKKVPLTPNTAQSQQILLLDEGVRVIQSACPQFSGLLKADEVDAPKFIFNEGGSPNERAEAILDSYRFGVGKYKGHWIKESALHTNKYVDLLATWIHEMSHKHGGDVSTEFTNALKNIETVILKTLTENPDALNKIKVLAEKYDGISRNAVREAALNEDLARYLTVESAETTENFDAQAYTRQIQSENQTLKEYKEYVSEQVPAKFVLPEEWETHVKYEPLTPMPKTEPVMNNIVPTTESSMRKLQTTGAVRVSIPDIGGAKPTNSENPLIHPQDIQFLGETRPAKIRIRYGEQINWSNFKIARDIMQNFYNGNGFTMEGVTVNVEKVNNDYKIRISGLGKYDYKHLERIGSSTSDNDIGRSAGNYGEGTRIVAANLLARGYGNLKFGCGDWALEFSKADGRMMKTLTQNPEFLNGNYLELSTTDAAFVEELIKAKDYFNHPFNKELQNMDFENDFLAFKRVDDNAEGQLFLVQKYEKNPDFNPSQHKLNIIFKRMPNDPELVSTTQKVFTLKTGCDRVGLNERDIIALTRRYARTMTGEQLIQSIATLEDFWTTTDPKNPMIVRDYDIGSIEQTFVKGLLIELEHRNSTEIDFGDKKIVAISSDTPSDIIQYFEKQGYRFTTVDAAQALGISHAKDLYAKEHRLQSIRPTETEAKKLQLINEALKVFAQNDNYGLFNRNPETPIYTFNAKESNCPEVHAHVEKGKIHGLFIDRNVLAQKNFLEIVQESLAQKLHTEGNDISANYSYALTDLMSLEFDAFIQNPTVAQKLQILKRLYDELDK